MITQAKILRGISGEKRLEQAIKLSDWLRELARENIKEQLGHGASSEKIQTRLFQRLHPSK